jgi:hypothetical protein
MDIGIEFEFVNMWIGIKLDNGIDLIYNGIGFHSLDNI